MTEDQYPPSQFMSITPSELFYRNRQMAGFGNPVQAVVSCVRELVENSLDACEDAGVPPVVLVRIDSHENGTVVISVADNGTGVPDEHVAESFAQVLYGSKYSFRQKRGSLGLGVTMAVLYSQITTGCPVEVHTSTVPNQGRVYRLLIDIEKNIPIVESVESVPRDHPGTTVSLKIKGDLARSRARLLDYVRLTSVSAPHARVQLVVDGVSQGIFGPWVDKIPPPTVPMRPHPRSADPELIRRLVANTSPETKLIVFLTQNFQCMSRAISRRFLGFIGIDPSM
ncbi:MAG: ATP-binding protein, partial [Candidatus Thorarchaeota archaeon]